jgi:hypothetical protein
MWKMKISSKCKSSAPVISFKPVWVEIFIEWIAFQDVWFVQKHIIRWKSTACNNTAFYTMLMHPLIKMRELSIL